MYKFYLFGLLLGCVACTHAQKEEIRLGLPKEHTHSIIFSVQPDGKYIATASTDGSFIIWETTSGNKTIGLKNSFELMQELFANVNRGTGATVIAASGGTQFAQEHGNLKNGVFTYSILELMQQRKEVKVSELKYIVGKRVEELTNGYQKPTSRNENIEFDWRVW